MYDNTFEIFLQHFYKLSFDQDLIYFWIFNFFPIYNGVYLGIKDKYIFRKDYIHVKIIYIYPYLDKVYIHVLMFR